MKSDRGAEGVQRPSARLQVERGMGTGWVASSRNGGRELLETFLKSQMLVGAF